MTIDSNSARFSRSLKSAILVPVGAIFLTAVVLLAILLWLFKCADRTEHSHQVIIQTERCRDVLVDIQNAVRGYALTGDKSFTDILDQDKVKADTLFSKLRTQVQESPEQSIRADELIRSKDLWVQQTDVIVTQRAKGATISPEWVRMGKQLMDDVQAKFDRFSEVENEYYSEQTHRVRRMKRVLGIAGGGLAIVLALSVAQMARRQWLQLASDYLEALKTTEQRHTALARSEADLEKQKEWFRVTLSSIGDGVIVTDAEGRIVFLNHEAERLTGCPSVEALLRPLPDIFKIVDEATRQRLENPVTRILREQKPIGPEQTTVLLSQMGDEWPIQETTAPIRDGHGKFLGVVLVFHNATEIRQTQNALRLRSEDLEKMVAERTTLLQQTVSELETFSYTVSHDLRSPLRAMQGYSQALDDDYGAKLDDTGRNYLTRIRNGAERLDRLIQDLLSYTRLSRVNEPMEPQDLQKIVQDIVDHYPNLQPPSCQVTIEGTLLPVLGRAATLTQVMANLLGNAAKFVSPGTVPQIKVRAENLGSRVRCWVEDNGIGIPSKDQERIFQIFVQVNASKVYGGTGVGLAIVRKAMQAMQGEAGVESAEGEGSRFWIELNRAPL